MGIKSSVMRDARRMAEAEGVEILEAGLTKGDHIKLRCRNQQGLVANIFMSATPSDFRAAAKRRSQLRRFADGRWNPLMERAA
ncbi:MAG: hypothetical protein ACK4MG_14245 [Aquabacterium sp.]|uniref:hypothetical protein n=1 Tax=uncultured Aquabacterium sp. TaxID=158753 RepID=UPI0025E8D99D|nr:hypothetical protein [uncultured Aquabacterium sp.]